MYSSLSVSLLNQGKTGWKNKPNHGFLALCLASQVLVFAPHVVNSIGKWVLRLCVIGFLMVYDGCSGTLSFFKHYNRLNLKHCQNHVHSQNYWTHLFIWTQCHMLTLHSPPTNCHCGFQSTVREMRDVQSTYCMLFFSSTCPLSHRLLVRKHKFENKISKNFKKATTENEVYSEATGCGPACFMSREQGCREKKKGSPSHHPIKHHIALLLNLHDKKFDIWLWLTAMDSGNSS